MGDHKWVEAITPTGFKWMSEATKLWFQPVDPSAPYHDPKSHSMSAQIELQEGIRKIEREAADDAFDRFEDAIMRRAGTSWNMTVEEVLGILTFVSNVNASNRCPFWSKASDLAVRCARDQKHDGMHRHGDTVWIGFQGFPPVIDQLSSEL